MSIRIPSRLFLMCVLGGILTLLNGCTSSPQEEKISPPSAPIVEEKLKAPNEPLKTGSLEPLKVFAPKHILKIALLLPLTGEKKDLGQALSKAAELGLFNLSSRPALEIFLRDTAGDPEIAKESLSNLLKEQEIDLILGPLTADETSAITPLAWEKVIPVLSFSNVFKVAGDNVFIMGFSPEEQIKEAVGFALSQNLTTFAIIAPIGEYGHLIVDSVRQSLYSFPHAKLKDIIFYTPTGADLEEKIKTLNLTEIQVLIIPEGGERLLQIVTLLNKDPLYQTIKPKLIGSGQWDDALTLANPLFQGGWFPGTRMDRRAEFNADYLQSYGQTPPRIASLGYDGIGVASEMVASPTSSTIEVLTRSQGFQGVDGAFHFTPQGLCIRTWSMYEINTSSPNHIKLLKSAEAPLQNNNFRV